MSTRHKSDLSTAHANRITKAIVRDTIRQLKEMTGGQVSGDYSGLASLWEEICVQVQRERSSDWDHCVATINSYLVPAVIALRPDERLGLWFETKAGWDWQYDHRDRRGTPPVDDDDIVVYLKDRLLTAAARFRGQEHPQISDRRSRESEGWRARGPQGLTRASPIQIGSHPHKTLFALRNAQVPGPSRRLAWHN